MTRLKVSFTKTAKLLTALILGLSILTPILMNNIVGASAMITSRAIQVTTSAGTATDVIYTLTFTTATTSNVGGIVVDVCSESPLLGNATCTVPTGFNWNKATLALGSQIGITGNAVDTTNSTAQKLILTRTASSIGASTAVTIPIGTGAGTAVTNPTANNTTYYARVFTFATTAGAQAYTSGTPGTYVDAGGIALSTGYTININTNVQEQLIFCVSAAAPGSNCGSGITTPNLSLGS
ncbi:MAG TPA: hypothetical protein VMR51_02245, partial [Patescibacteria group bacterium]|nr:hypothetical protein [Patescibacteria group bacterium]